MPLLSRGVKQAMRRIILWQIKPHNSLPVDIFLVRDNIYEYGKTCLPSGIQVIFCWFFGNTSPFGVGIGQDSSCPSVSSKGVASAKSAAMGFCSIHMTKYAVAANHSSSHRSKYCINCTGNSTHKAQGNKFSSSMTIVWGKNFRAQKKAFI